MIALILSLILSVVPACVEEDGSGQAVCGWDDGTGATVLNVAEHWIAY